MTPEQEAYLISKMRRQVAHILVVVLALILLVNLFLQKQSTAELKEYWENKDFKTDSVKVEIDYTKLPIPQFKFDVPPVKVIEYTRPRDVNNISLNFNDSLITVIDSLQNHIYTLNALYLKLYPEASKLIYAQFSADSVRLDLLSTQGRVYSSRVAVNYARFQYQYTDGHFRASPITSGKQPKDLHALLYSYIGYGTKPVIGADYYIYKGKFRAGVNTFLSIEQEPQFWLTGNIGYKLHGN